MYFQKRSWACYKEALENKGSQIKQTNGIPILIGMKKLPKASRFQKPSLNDSLQKGMKN